MKETIIPKTNCSLIEPHGNILIDRSISTKKFQAKKQQLKSITIANRFVSDCEMIANGGFSPLIGFMSKDEITSVIENMTLLNGLIWSIPIPLHIPKEEYDSIEELDEVVLQNENGEDVAILFVEEKFELDLNSYCEVIFKTTDLNHPGVKFTHSFGKYCISGEIRVCNTTTNHNSEVDEHYYTTPKELREIISKNNWNSLVAFQTRNPIHRAHEYLIKCALESNDAVLIHPIVGETKSDDIPASVRMQCYETLIEHYFNTSKTQLSVLPTAMRYAGPREAIHHLIIRQNYGCTHLIIGRDHAGVGDYYGTYEAQELVKTIQDRLKIKPLFYEHSFYCKKCENLASIKTCPHSKEYHTHLSGTKVREMLQEGECPPKEFSRAEVAQILVEWATKRQ